MMNDPNFKPRYSAGLEPIGVAGVAGTVTAWEIARFHIQALLRLEADWDGEGAPAIRPELIRSALQLATRLMKVGHPAPHDVYPLPDGNIILEWQFTDGVITRIEVVGAGKGELMETYPNDPAEFVDLTWHAPPAHPANGPEVAWEWSANVWYSPRLDESEGTISSVGCANFQLAA